MRGRKFKLRQNPQQDLEVGIVGGPLPYLWIGKAHLGPCYATEDRARSLRALGKALVAAADQIDRTRGRKP